jgi:cationic amino acid transporter 4
MHANSDNWFNVEGGFMPYGISGVLAGSATCFYAFVGFDSIATSSEEARNPTISIPLATILSLSVVTVGYVLVSAAITLMVPYTQINPAAALPDAFGSLNITWAKYAISIGAICGMTTTLLGSLFALPRCLYAMASDGLLFSCFGKVNSKTQVPMLNVVVSGFSSALLALLFDLEKLVEFMSIGTLLAYTIVSASVIILRYRPISVEETVHLAPDTPGTDDDEEEEEVDSATSHSEPQSPTSEMIEVALAGRLRPQFRWLEPVLGKCEPGTACSAAVLLFCVLSVAICFQLEVSWNDLTQGTWWALLLYGFLLFCIVACNYQNPLHLKEIDF